LSLLHDVYTHRVGQWVPGAVSPRVKRQGRDADHSPLTSAEIKKGGAIPLLPRTSSWRAYLIKFQVFTFTILWH
jgi:hypothetical protein